MAQQKPHIFLMVLNTMALVGMIVVNASANTLPLNGMNTGELSDAIPNLFVPSGRTFAIWGLIYTLLIVFVVYQYTSRRTVKEEEDPVGLVGPWFFISCVANSLWIFAWHWQLQIPSIIIMLVLLATLIVMYTKSRLEDASLGFRIAVMLPISIYLGWITVATIANATSMLVVFEWNRFGLSEVFWTVAVMVVAIIINLLAIIIRGDIWFALVGAWALYGIYTKRTMTGIEPVPMVVYTAVAGVFAIGIAVIIHLIVKGRRVAREGY